MKILYGIIYAIDFLFTWIFWAFRQGRFYPPNGEKNGESWWYPYDKKMLWRTRYGFKTAYGLTQSLLNMKYNQLNRKD